jgi:hypothetical protein
MKKTTLILIASMLSSTAIFAQTKIDALNAYFCGEVPNCEAGAVRFIYETSEVTRTAKGGETMIDVLKNSAAFQNTTSYGAVKTVLVNNKTVKGCGVKQTPEKVKPLFGDEKPTRAFATMADSATMKNQVDEIKQGYDDISNAFGTFWGYFFGLFQYVMFFLGVFGIVFYSISKLSAKEYENTGKWQDKIMLGLQRSASLVLFIDVSFFMVMILLQIAFYVSKWNWNVVWKLLFIFGIAWVMVEIAAVFIPNTKTDIFKGNNRDGRNNNGNDFKQLR